MTEEIAAAAEVVASDPREKELVGLAKSRSPEAWTEIYNRHYSAIYRYVKARVFEEATAEDLTSAVFVGALKSIDSYQYRGKPLLAWLYRITRNVVASHQRELLVPKGEGLKRTLDMPRRVVWHLMRRSRPDDEQGGEEIAAVASSEEDPATMIERLDLRNALQGLTDTQREVVILRFFVGLSTQEIAQVMGKDASAVYSLQARALVALREQLQ